MDPIAILQNRIEQLEAKLGVATGQPGGDSRVQAGDSVAANLMNAHAAMASGAAGHDKVTAAMAQATELNNYTSPDVMQHMQQRQMQMHEVAAAEPAIRHHCHCMHRCKQAAPALESDMIPQVPQMQATVDQMKAETASIKSEADMRIQLNSPRPSNQEHGNAQMSPHMQMQGNPNAMNVYQATTHNNTPFQEHANPMQGNQPAPVDPKPMHGNPNQIRGNPNAHNVMHGNPNEATSELQRYRNNMFGGSSVATAMYGNSNVNNAMHGNPNVASAVHGSRNVAPNEMHANPQMVHAHHNPNVMNGNPNAMIGNPNMMNGNVDVVAGYAQAYTGHAHPDAMPHPQMVHGNHEGLAAHDGLQQAQLASPRSHPDMSGHMQHAQPTSPRSHPEVSQGIQQLAETCGATAGSASEQLASVTQKVEQAELRKYQRRNGLD